MEVVCSTRWEIINANDIFVGKPGWKRTDCLGDAGANIRIGQILK
jgi:hypothetical protein